MTQLRVIHDRIPYRPIDERVPIEWPGGASVAVWVVPNIEHYEYLPPAGAVDPYPRTPHPDVRKFAYHDYGNRVGFWRLLEVFDRHDVVATASLNVAVLDHYPEIKEAMIERHWDFMCHGLYNTRYLTGLDAEEEFRFLLECNAALERHTGKPFSGMLGPNITANRSTPETIAEAGMRYHADWVHDERPTPLLVGGGGALVAIPYSYELNDAPLLMRSHVEGSEYAAMCVAQFDRLRRDAVRWGGLVMALPLHPFAIGQPHRIGALDRVLGHLRQHGAWFATASEIVDVYAARYLADELTASAEPRR